MALLTKLRHKYIWERIFRERLSEPLHLNIFSTFIALFGSFRAKVAFDLVIRQHHAYSILAAADHALSTGEDKVTLIEFGVASGAGLLNICAIAQRVTQATGVQFSIVGFDTGRGMPPPRSYLDHPDLYQEGDFPMDVERLRSRLPTNARLVIGPLSETVPAFIGDLEAMPPIGFVSLDVDYYSSSVDALKLFDGPATSYLPRVEVYLDDVHEPSHNAWCGERLAVAEFNRDHPMRKLEHHPFLRSSRIMKAASWIDHMVTLHVLDHPTRSTLVHERGKVSLENPYLV